MTDREKQISEMSKIISEMYSVYDTTAEDIAQGLFEKGYRKMDEVTLKLDLGDRTAEEIKQIAEAFNADIKKQVAKEILQDWYDDVVHGMGVDGYYIKEYAKKYGVKIDE